MQLKVQKLHGDAKLPTFAHDADAGMDLYALEDSVIEAGARAQVRTGIAIGVPPGYVGLIWDKSGLANKVGITVLGGVVDAGYTGEIVILLHNTGVYPHEFKAGDKITQMLIQKVEHPDIIEAPLEETQRGDSGFGSTGK